ncbi:MAG: signal recognition particle protein [Acidaminococcus sp.]|jgi:signal recognition particle subunit SRP54|nr:signal recognition particle protein [Acidaminococcus sp.]MCI2099942.1 signal recognition particle protein [Acidaminococcus sp.]MCI2114173.1 signal recognition particle protein [Acidaminococcus sp.]MCI2116343.1 signal recognition particle protein [Acidaminococcus sp.]
MAFEMLTDKLTAAIQKIRGHKTVTEQDLKETLREVRLALLEADVNFKVVKEFTAKIKERAQGQQVDPNLTAGQYIVKIVHEELINLLGGTQSKLNFSANPPTIIMLVGLQGAGKTTSVGKLANYLRKNGKKPLMVAGDVYRPAAITQLEVIGKQLDMPVFSMGDQVSPVEIAKASIKRANELLCDTILIDTAGRLHIDEKLMDELKNIKSAVNPNEILLVVDAMTGQDAVNVADAFNKALGITGLIVTKLDGDARGGAVLSVKAVADCPVKFVGMGEKLDALDPFYPDRMASRILGMGDVLSLIEKAQEAIDVNEAKKLADSMKKNEFTLDMFLDQMKQVKKLGSLESIISLIPGMSKYSKQLEGIDLDGKEVRRLEAIITSMTPKERQNPRIINGSRRKRIAAGCGQSVQAVNRLLKQFEESKKLMKTMTGMNKYARKGRFKLPFMQ